MENSDDAVLWQIFTTLPDSFVRIISWFETYFQKSHMKVRSKSEVNIVSPWLVYIWATHPYKSFLRFKRYIEYKRELEWDREAWLPWRCLSLWHLNVKSNVCISLCEGDLHITHKEPNWKVGGEKVGRWKCGNKIRTMEGKQLSEDVKLVTLFIELVEVFQLFVKPGHDGRLRSEERGVCCVPRRIGRPGYWGQ
jgi:hypothetical protein